MLRFRWFWEMARQGAQEMLMPVNLVHKQMGCTRSGGRHRIGRLRLFNLTESFAVDSLQMPQLETIDAM